MPSSAAQGATTAAPAPSPNRMQVAPILPVHLFGQRVRADDQNAPHRAALDKACGRRQPIAEAGTGRAQIEGGGARRAPMRC